VLLPVARSVTLSEACDISFKKMAPDEERYLGRGGDWGLGGLAAQETFELCRQFVSARQFFAQ
jgi:hypothetical protein